MTERSFACPKCGRDEFPNFVLANSGKLIAQCSNPDCGFEDPTKLAAHFNSGVAAVGTTEAGPGWGGKEAVEVETTTSAPAQSPRPFSMRPAPPARPLSSPPPPQAAAFSASPGDVIGWIEQRSLYLSAEEARIEGELASARATLAGIRAEQKRLVKMLRAGRKVQALEPTAPRITHTNCAGAAAPLEN